MAGGLSPDSRLWDHGSTSQRPHLPLLLTHLIDPTLMLTLKLVHPTLKLNLCLMVPKPP